MPPATPSRPAKRLVIFCDGTWVGRETAIADAPPSNIRQLANMVGEVQYTSDPLQQPATIHPIKPHKSTGKSTAKLDSTSCSFQPDIIAGYQEGVGLNRTFLEYIWDGATASAIGDECISVYKFIVDNYTSDHEIWLFGFSRGAFTVRCVAGMINNCGIIKRLEEYTEDEVQTLCYEVFRTYRSNVPLDAPKSDKCQRLKGDPNRVWPVNRPIRFMGLIDTVGALGIPRLNAGIGFDWSPFEFFDQHVSSVVQHVYHAPAIHERLWIFQPCLVDLSEGDEQEKAVVHQQWFPGTHYDVGRMTFRFVRQSPANWVEGLLGWLPDLLSRTIYPNEVLSDTVLRWLVEGIRDTDSSSSNPIIFNIDCRVEDLRLRLASPSPKSTGSGDIYGDVLNYAPAGIIFSTTRRFFHFIFSLLNRILPRLGDNINDLIGIRTILGILTATSDRRIPDSAANVYPYTQEEHVVIRGVERSFCVQQMAKMKGSNEWGKERYASRTYESFLLWRRIFGGKKDL